jgi:hypothetical protein
VLGLLTLSLLFFGLWKASAAPGTSAGATVALTSFAPNFVATASPSPEFGISNDAAAVPIAAAKPIQEAHLELDLSESNGGSTFDVARIAPCDQRAMLADGRTTTVGDLKAGDRVCLTGGHIGRVLSLEKSWHIPAPPQSDGHGNSAQRVLATTKRLTDRVLYLYTDAELVKTTAEHPFAVVGKGFVRAGSLKAGDVLETADGRSIAVQRTEDRAGRELVYNLEVENAHNFYVGQSRFLVHNGGDCVPTLSQAKELLGQWNKSSFRTRADSLRYHFNRHGAEVGAKDVWQYMRKAEGFKQNLRGAGKAFLDDGKIRYMKDRRYIILDSNKDIISFGILR